MVTPDNQPVDVDEKDFDAALKNGLTPAMEYADKEGNISVVKKPDQRAAEATGMVPRVIYEGKKDLSKFDDAQAPGKVESFARGLANAGTFGFSDEIGGASNAIKRALQKGSLQDLKSDYQSGRDSYRAGDDKAWETNPVAYGTGVGATLIGGGVGSALGKKAAQQFVPTLGQKVVSGAKTGAGLGGVAGAGGSTADLTEGEKEQFLKDVGVGTALGGVLGGGAEGVIGSVARGAKGFKQGLNQAAEDIEKGTGGSIFDKAVKIGRSTFTGAKENTKVENELRELAILKNQEKFGGQRGALGGGQTPGDTTALLEDLFKPGANPVKEYIVNKAETTLPGNMSVASKNGKQSLVSKVFSMSPDERAAARTFNKDEASKSVVSDLVDTFKNIKENRSNIFAGGQSAAEEAFDSSNIIDVAKTIRRAMKDAKAGSLGGNVNSALKKAQAALEKGQALSTYKIQKGAIDPANSVDSFRRLQAARESLDPALQAARQAGDTQQAFVLGNVRKAIDDQLKSSAPKAFADKAYAEITQPLKAILKPITDKESGKINPYKLGATFNDSTMGKTFRDNITQLSNVVNTYSKDMDPAQLAGIQKTLNQLQDFAKVSQNQKLLNSLRQIGGPSSPAIERASAALNKAGIDTGLITNPSSALTQADNILLSGARRLFNKEYGELNPEEMSQVVKLLMDPGKASIKAKDVIPGIKELWAKRKGILGEEGGFIGKKPTTPGTLEGVQQSNYRGVDVNSTLNKTDVDEMFRKSEQLFKKPFTALTQEEKTQVLNSMVPKGESYQRNLRQVGMDAAPETAARVADAAQRIFKKPFATLTSEQKQTVLEKLNDGSMGQIPDMKQILKEGYDRTSQSRIEDELMSYSRKPRK